MVVIKLWQVLNDKIIIKEECFISPLLNKIGKLLIFIVLSQFYTSCSIKGSFRGLYSYYEKTNKESPNLLKGASSICGLKNDNHIYVINGLELKKCLKNEKESLVYFWSPKCFSKVCISLNMAQEICSKKGIKLYIVAEYYDSELMNKKYDLETPIFGIDTKYYSTNLTEKYMKKFIIDIEATKDQENRFLYYKNGEFFKNYENIEQLN